MEYVRLSYDEKGKERRLFRVFGTDRCRGEGASCPGFPFDENADKAYT